MKIKGRKLEGPRKKIVPIIRDESEGGTIIFIVQGVVDLQPFFAICPTPKPPMATKPGKVKVPNFEDKGYIAAMDAWWQKRTNWMGIKSLEGTEDLEWETVSMTDPETYKNWTTELQAAGLVDAELTRLMNAIMEVNGLSETLVEEARQSFLTSQASQENGQSSPLAEAPTTQSGNVA